MLRASSPYCDDALKKLAEETGIGGSAEDFIRAVDKLISDAGIDTGSVKFRPEDVDAIVEKAQDEAKSTGYPRPFSEESLKKLITYTLV